MSSRSRKPRATRLDPIIHTAITAAVHGLVDGFVQKYGLLSPPSGHLITPADVGATPNDACVVCHGIFLPNMPVIKKEKLLFHAWCYMWREVKRSDSDGD